MAKPSWGRCLPLPPFSACSPRRRRSTRAFAFHASLAAAASLAAVFVDPQPLLRPAGGAAARRRSTAGPTTIWARSSSRSVMAMFWGIAGFAVGLLIASPAGVARAQFRPAVDQLRPAAAAAHLGGDLRVRRQRADRDLVLCRAEDLPRAARRRSRALVRRRRLQLLHPDRRHRLSARRHPIQGICRAGMVRRSLADHRLGDLSAGLPGDASSSARNRTSSSPTGSISPSSSPSPCCISATIPRCRSRCSARNPTSPGAACRTPCSSGGTGTTRSASS